MLAALFGADVGGMCRRLWSVSEDGRHTNRNAFEKPGLRYPSRPS